MEMKKVLDRGKARAPKPRKKRWSKDDTELFLLSLPTLQIGRASCRERV